MFLFVFVLSDVTTNILQVRVNWFSELLQTLVCFRLEVLQYVLKVMFLAKIKLESETGQMINDKYICELFTLWLGDRLT